MRATIFLYSFAHSFFCKGENLTVNRTHLVVPELFGSKTFLENQGL
jgi:hypothetical protein